MNDVSKLTVKEQVGMIVGTIAILAVGTVMVVHGEIPWKDLIADLIATFYTCVLLTRTYKKVTKEEMCFIEYFVLMVAFAVFATCMAHVYGLYTYWTVHVVLTSMLCVECFGILFASSLVMELTGGK